MNISSNLRLLRSIPRISNLSINQLIQSRQSSYNTSPFVCDREKPDIKYEVSKNPEEWKYVERVLPPLVVPQPTQKMEYPSNWKPQSPDALKHPYFIQRTKNHMVPVYMQITYRGIRRITYIRKVQGDIWKLEKDIRAFLQQGSVKPLRIQVHEFAGYICIHGDHVNAVKEWLLEKGF